MRRPLVAASLLSLLGPAAHGQFTAEIQAGAAWSSSLVEDSIVNAITLAPQLAPTVAIAVGAQLGERYGIAGRVRWARSNLQRRELGEASTVLPLTVWIGTAVLQRTMWRRVSAELQFGAIKYAPAGNTDGTVFQDDAPLVATVGAGLRAEHPIGERLAVGIHVGYDLHQFDTQSLRSSGFTSARLVHRLAVSATLRRRQQHGSP